MCHASYILILQSSETDLDASQSAAEETLEDLETQDFEQAKQETGDICDERGQGGGRGERDYAIFTNLDGVIIDGRFHRNLGMMVAPIILIYLR